MSSLNPASTATSNEDNEPLDLDVEGADEENEVASGTVTHRHESNTSVTPPSSVSRQNSGTWIEAYAMRASIMGKDKWKCGFCRYVCRFLLASL